MSMRFSTDAPHDVRHDSSREDSGVICLEMMKKITTPDFDRRSARPSLPSRVRKSQFFNFRRIFKTAVDVMRLWRRWSSCISIDGRPERRRYPHGTYTSDSAAT